MPIHLKRTGIQLAEPFSERRLLNNGRYRSTWHPPYALQTKLDGERCRAHVKDGMCLLVSSTDSLIMSVPHINRLMCLLPNGEYDGELYIHGKSFNELHSIISTHTKIHPAAHTMQYHLFDIINPSPQHERIKQLYSNLIIHKDARPYIKKVRIDFAVNLQEIMSLYDEYIDLGYEGFIIRELTSYYLRRRSQLMMKFKPKQTDTYPIWEINEAISESGLPLNMVGSFTCIDEMATKFRVGAGKLIHSERKSLWEQWIDLDNLTTGTWKLKLEYQTLSDKNKVPHFSRAVEVIK